MVDGLSHALGGRYSGEFNNQLQNGQKYLFLSVNCGNI